MTLKLNGTTSGSVSLDAPATGSDVSLTLPTLGFGKVLQVVQGTHSTETTSTSSSFSDTGLTATITPSSTDSKVLVLVQQQVAIANASTHTIQSLRLVRASTTVTTWTRAFAASTGAANEFTSSVTLLALDSPATTSATAYKTTQARNSGSGTVYTQSGSTQSTIILVEVGP